MCCGYCTRHEDDCVCQLCHNCDQKLAECDCSDYDDYSDDYGDFAMHHYHQYPLF